jgi:hypothetical protein
MDKGRVVSICTIAALVGSYAIGFGICRNNFVSRLEPDAIYCGYRNNVIGFPDWGINLPKLKNKDVDGNGRYESILLYKDSTGRKMYQEVTKTEQGGLRLGEPKDY